MIASTDGPNLGQWGIRALLRDGVHLGMTHIAMPTRWPSEFTGNAMDDQREPPMPPRRRRISEAQEAAIGEAKARLGRKLSPREVLNAMAEGFRDDGHTADEAETYRADLYCAGNFIIKAISREE